jgi:hypothetical protein
MKIIYILECIFWILWLFQIWIFMSRVDNLEARSEQLDSNVQTLRDRIDELIVKSSRLEKSKKKTRSK